MAVPLFAIVARSKFEMAGAAQIISRSGEFHFLFKDWLTIPWALIVSIKIGLIQLIRASIKMNKDGFHNMSASNPKIIHREKLLCETVLAVYFPSMLKGSIVRCACFKKQDGWRLEGTEPIHRCPSDPNSGYITHGTLRSYGITKSIISLLQSHHSSCPPQLQARTQRRWP